MTPSWHGLTRSVRSIAGLQTSQSRWQSSGFVKRIGAAACFLGAALITTLVPPFSAEAAERDCAGEAERAATTARQLVDQWPVRGDDAVSSYISSLGLRLAETAVPRAPFNWRFIIVRNYAANAMAIGDGYIFVTDGTIRFADDESEVAAVLAHEIGHQIAGHLCRAAAHIDHAWWDPAGWLQSRTEQIKQAGVGSLVQIIDVDKEIEADRAGVAILNKTGLDPYAMLRVLTKLAAAKSSPDYAKRRAALEAELRKYLPSRTKNHSAETFVQLKQLVEENRM
jgi:beta-barrel assembly-enhancing protease